MKNFFKKWWNDFKTFDWKMYLALCLLALVPAIYQTIVTGLVSTHASPGSLDIVGQMEWFDLIDETICAFLIIPMYSVLSKAKKTESFNKIVFKLGIIVVALYALFSLGTFFYGIHLVSFMNPNEIDVGAAYRYLSLETVAFMIGIVFSYVSVVFIVIDDIFHHRQIQQISKLRKPLHQRFQIKPSVSIPEFDCIWILIQIQIHEAHCCT